jgi:hypothetical protein
MGIPPTLKAAAQTVVTKQDSWVKANRKPLIIGAAAMLGVVILILGIVHLL